MRDSSGTRRQATYGSLNYRPPEMTLQGVARVNRSPAIGKFLFVTISSYEGRSTRLHKSEEWFGSGIPMTRYVGQLLPALESSLGGQYTMSLSC